MICNFAGDEGREFFIGYSHQIAVFYTLGICHSGLRQQRARWRNHLLRSEHVSQIIHTFAILSPLLNRDTY